MILLFKYYYRLFPKAKKKVKVLSSFVLLCGLVNSVWAETSVRELRLWRSPDKTRVVLDLSAPATHKVFTLNNPDRVVVDVPNASISTDYSSLDLKDTPIVSIRHAKKDQHDLRMVLDLSSSVDVKSFFLKKNGDAHDRLVLDLLEDKGRVKITKKNVQEIRKGQRDIIIAIDAGHGGEDPGALGPKNIYEKKKKNHNTFFKLILSFLISI